MAGPVAVREQTLDSGLHSRVYLSLRSKANANWRRREEDWAECGRDPLLRAQRLTPASSSDAGRFPRYAETDVETLTFVRRVQGLGFKLSEIRGLLRLRGDRLQPCAPVQRRLQEKLADVQRKLADLHKLEHELRLALRSCKREMRKQHAHCPILRDRNPQEPETGK